MQTNNFVHSNVPNLLKDLWQKYQNEIREIQDDKSKQPCLYHYTTAEGLIGILSSDRIRATDIIFLNDKSEMNYAIQLLEECQSSLVSQLPSVLVKKLLEMVVATLQRLKFTFRPFVACFCEDGNLLNQWRAYGSNGGGFAIGFDREDLFKVADRHVDLYKITYVNEVQRRLLISGMKIVCDDLMSGFPTVDYRADSAIVDFYEPALSRWLARCLVSFKHPLFEEEKEWRLVYLPTIEPFEFDKMDFHTTDGKIKPYINLELASSAETKDHKLPIREIIYGPTHASQIEDSLTLLITKYGYATQAVIKGSNIPFTD